MVILVKYGFENNISCKKMDLADAKDTVVLLQNGVFWAFDKKMDSLREKGVNVFAIKDDFLARGYKEDDSKVPLISYVDFIDIVEKDQKTIG